MGISIVVCVCVCEISDTVRLNNNLHKCHFDCIERIDKITAKFELIFFLITQVSRTLSRFC